MEILRGVLKMPISDSTVTAKSKNQGRIEYREKIQMRILNFEICRRCQTQTLLLLQNAKIARLNHILNDFSIGMINLGHLSMTPNRDSTVTAKCKKSRG